MLISKPFNNNNKNFINNMSNYEQQESKLKFKKEMNLTNGKKVPTALTVNGTTPSGKPRLYVCNTCTRAFARQEHLKRHERSHTQEKPFVCGVCERLFSRRDLLLRHAQKLHAGCADAITRIRKKTSRRKSSVSSNSMSRKSSTISSTNFRDDNDDDEIISNNPFNNIKVEFSQNLEYPDIPSNVMTNPTSSVSPPTPNLQQQQQQLNNSRLDYQKRRASFSAVSSANYAMPIPNTSYAESVEFATPSLNAVQPNWLNGFQLDAIPELNLFNLDPQLDNKEKSPFESREASIQEDAHQRLPNISGYSFYDNEEDGAPVVESLFNNHHLFKTTQDRKNEYGVLNYNQQQQIHDDDAASSLELSPENNVDRNLNEIEEITDLNISKMYDMPAGYSFYGNVDLLSNSTSSNATISPSLLDALSHGINSGVPTPPQRVIIQTANTFNAMLKMDKYSRVLLFSPILRSHINHTLNNYPFVGVKVPNLPSNDRLNVYLNSFVDRFLPHYPFVHKSMLNEYALMRTTLDDVDKDRSPLVMNQIELDNLRASISCLPLLVATIGALLSDEKQDATSLYEVSRRSIHVYLDSRKKKSTEQRGQPAGLNSNNASPLWLIQSLTLSVIYGLYADNDVSINVVIRQVNALTSLIKSSEMTKIKWDYNSISMGERVIDENYYYDFIKYESAVRTVHSIFHIVVTLTSLYNIAPSLKIDDLELDLPNSSILWNSSNYNEFKSFYNGFAFQPENYKKCLNSLISLDILSVTNELNHSGGFFFNHHVSDFGLICLQNGLHQLFYYDKLYGINNITRLNSNVSIRSAKDRDSLQENYLNVSRIWNLMINQCKLFTKSNDLAIDSKLMNYHLLLKKSAYKLQLQLNLKLHKLKEQVWLKDWDKMFEILQGNNELSNVTDSLELLELISYCFLIIREIFYPEQVDHNNFKIPDYVNNYQQYLSKEVGNFLDNIDERFCDLNHLVKISSLQFQILFDVFIILIKFIMNFNHSQDDDANLELDLENLFSFKNSPINEDGMDIDSPSPRQITNDINSINLKIYKAIIKLINSLENCFRDKFQFNNIDDNYKESLDNLMLLNSGLKRVNSMKNSDNEIFTGLKEIVNSQSRIDKPILQKGKLINKFFHIIDFIFDYMIFNKLKFKFGCFKNMNCGLIKLKFFLNNNNFFNNVDVLNINDNENDENDNNENENNNNNNNNDVNDNANKYIDDQIIRNSINHTPISMNNGVFNDF